MKKERLQHFRRLLEREQRELRERLAHLEDNRAGGLQDSLSELSVFDNHPADIGTETFERSKDIGLRDLNRLQLDRNRRALRRLEEGTYGRCRSCGAAIPEDRLEAMPAAELCLKCQETQEERVSRYRRPVEEGVVMPPFGGFAEDRLYTEQEVEFDGEDSWQAVARYGNSSDLVKGELGLPATEAGEDLGVVEDVDSIPCYYDHEGVLYRDYRGRDDEGAPGEPLR